MQGLLRSDADTFGLIALGANLPSGARSPAQTVLRALDLLAKLSGAEVSASRLYQTPAFPAGSGPDFVNAAAKIRWPGEAEALLALLHRVEQELGRTRQARWEARRIDLDLIALGDLVLPDAATQRDWAQLAPERAARETPDQLILPHPRLAERSFVLVPLAELAPDWRHPLDGRTVAEMLAARPADERSEIRPIDAPSPLSSGTGADR